MNESIASLGSATDSTYGHGQPSHTPAEVADPSPDELGGLESADSTDLRLIIEGSDADGALVYKTVDGRTGEVVRAWRREQVLNMRDATTYVAGQVIKTCA